MKILYVINSLSGGGAEVFVTQLAISMKKDWKNNVCIVTYMGVLDSKGSSLKEQLEKNGIAVYDLNCKKFFSKLLVPFYLKKIYKQYKPDIVHSHLEQSDIFTAISKIGLFNSKIYFVRTVHSTVHWKRIPVFFNKLLFTFFNKNVGCSDQIKTHFTIPSVRHKLISIPNGIIIKDINHSELYKYKLRKQLSIPNDKVVYLNIGRFVKNVEGYTKGQDLILDTLNGDEMLKESIFIIFLGTGPDYDQFLKKYSHVVNCESVRFEGLVDNVIDYIIASDVVLMPSLFEGLPITAIETVCYGKPLICTDIVGFSSFNLTSTIKVNNSSELLSAIKDMMENIEYYSAEAKINSVQYKKIFDIKIVAEKYLQIYNN